MVAFPNSPRETLASPGHMEAIRKHGLKKRERVHMGANPRSGRRISQVLLKLQRNPKPSLGNLLSETLPKKEA